MSFNSKTGSYGRNTNLNNLFIMKYYYILQQALNKITVGKIFLVLVKLVLTVEIQICITYLFIMKYCYMLQQALNKKFLKINKSFHKN